MVVIYIERDQEFVVEAVVCLTGRVPTGVPKPSILCGRGKIPQWRKGWENSEKKGGKWAEHREKQYKIGWEEREKLKAGRVPQCQGREGLQVACYAEVPAGGLSELGQKVVTSGLPWWSSDEQSTCQRREQGFNPLSEKILHASGQLSLSTRTLSLSSRATNHNYWSPCILGPVLCNKRNHCNEKPAHHN